MLVEIVKRNGVQEAFSTEKIERAISKAGVEVDIHPTVLSGIASVVAQEVAARVEDLYMNEQMNRIGVDFIHNTVESLLMTYNAALAKAYVVKRVQKKADRSNGIISGVEGILHKTDEDTMNENSNKDARVIPVQRDLLAGTVAKEYALANMLPKDVAAAHKSGAIHYHDLDYSPFFPMYNCMLIDVEGMLTKGFKMGNTQIDTPKSFYVACQVTAQIIAQVASHIYGGNTINGIDRILAPYVTLSFRKHFRNGVKYIYGHDSYIDMDNYVFDEDISHDNMELVQLWCKAYTYAEHMTSKEVYDGIQSLEYEVNTLFTANGQSPFTTFGIESVTSWEGREIQKAIFKNRIRGIGKDGKTAIFPKLVYKQEAGNNLNPDDPNYDIRQLALECAAKRMYPDIVNAPLIREVTGSFKFPMGCRSFLSAHTNSDGELLHDGRMNLGVISVNLPQVALKVRGSKNLRQEFYKELDKVLDIAYEGLKYRIHRLDGVKAEVAPILYCEGATGFRLQPHEEISQIFKNGYASVSLGYIGVHETILALFGEKAYGNNTLEKIGLEIVQYLANKTKQWKAETGYGFSLYSTPSENLCNRFCAIDTKTFGVIPEITDKGYYTNSFHLDVQEKVNPFEKMDFEKKYPAIASGGFISYVEVPSLVRNVEALDKIWRESYDRNPYFAINTPTDKCFDCGYDGEFTATEVGYECPNCGNHEPKRMSVVRRCCGYLSEPSDRPFNKGKQEEVKRRVKHC